jgi:tetratricopeptide (TPR) repeat protein
VFKRLFLLAVLVYPAVAEDSRISVVKGTITAEEPLAGNHLIVNLIDCATHTRLERSYVGGDGSFEFRNVRPGDYTVQVATPDGDPIREETMRISSNGAGIEIRLPVWGNKPGPATGTVSVRQLRSPLSGKSKRMFDAAQKASAAGDFLKEIEILRGTLKDASAVPYARINLGVAYVRAGQAATAIPEFQEAARLMPDDSVVHSNLAYALLLTKRMDEAEVEGRRALELDGSNFKARWVMGSILLDQGSHVEEAVEDLHFASREIPKARVMLAIFYERSGQKDEAARELRAFLPQASSEERVKVEQWLSKLVAK